MHHSLSDSDLFPFYRHVTDLYKLHNGTLVSSFNHHQATYRLLFTEPLCIQLFWCWVSLGTPVTISLIVFYFIMILFMIVVTIIVNFMTIHYFLNYNLGFL